MNRAELVEAIAKQTGHTKADTDRLLTAFTTVVEKNIKKNDGVSSFRFSVLSQFLARKGRNPQTGEEIKIQLVQFLYSALVQHKALFTKNNSLTTHCKMGRLF